jgi:NAD(P)-dependent dehydrogenase (short-subunit alcohol dehydrogenase family)
MSLPGGPGEHAAIITGVSRGLGAALAELLERGFTVAGIGRTGNPALSGPRYDFVRFDLDGSSGVDAALAPALEGLKERRPASVCLANNAAAVGSVGMLGRLAASEITSALMVNLAAAVALANLFCRVFAIRGCHGGSSTFPRLRRRARCRARPRTARPRPASRC